MVDGNDSRLHTRIGPRQGFIELNLDEFWAFRDLLYFLVWRDILIRYKQTVLGAMWAVLQPLATMVIFAIVFGHLAHIPSDNIPYPVFAYSALVFWNLFAQSVTQSSNSLILNESLVTKVYFPRVFVPLASVLSCLLDFCIAFCLLFVLLPYYGVSWSPNIWAIPPLAAIVLIAATGTGLWISALNVRYRDFRYVVPFLTQGWMFITPVVYPASLIPEGWRTLYCLNPMAGAIEGFRWALFGTTTDPWPLVGAGAATSLVIAVSGLIYFQHTEDMFADII